MSSALIRTYGWVIEKYLNGSLPIPPFVLDGLLKASTEYHYRFSPTRKELPPGWDGSDGPLAEQSRELMQVHYDLPLALFENFLGPTMKYTMALYERGATNLEEAQVAMMDDLCDKAGVQDGDAVLDIACGFGSLSKHILQRYPSARVTAVNLSQTQVDYILSKQSEPGHPMQTDRFRIIKEDFSTFQFDRKFDRIMVIGLFEHIRNLRLALEKIAQLLKPNGKVLLHFITYQRIIDAMADPNSDLFFGRYIFPGGRFWYFHELPRYQEHLKVEQSWFLNGNNYKHTLEAWLRNLWSNIDKIHEHPRMDDKFIRVWDLYLRFCIAIFGGMGGRNLGNGQYLLRHARPVA
jgi:cyclopropane-fatty-acyl-phospholipid synthase